MDAPTRAPTDSSDSIALEATGLTKRFGPLVAVDGLSLSVRRGEVFGFLGPNGAGKTTSISLMCGLLRPDAGTVRIGGVAVGSVHDRDSGSG